MQKFLTVRVCPSYEEGGVKVYEPPEIKELLEDGWVIKSINPCAAGAGSDDSGNMVTTAAFIVLEK